jgi:hypothetical protein
MISQRCALALLAYATPFAVLAESPAASASTVEYLYVEANEGSSAGGHVALRVDDHVFDFQNAELGTLRRRRTDWDQFRYIYSVRENRTIHVARLSLLPKDRDAVRERFNRGYLIQNKHFSVWETLRSDRDLIERLLASKEGASDGHARWAPRVRGAGLFRLDGNAASDGSAGLAALRERIADERGANYLDHRIRALEEEAETLVPTADAPVFRLSDVESASSTYHFSDRYRDLCEKILALRVLRASAELHPDVRVVSAGERYALDSMERAQLRSFADAQEARLARLVASGRPDWGFALIVGMARLQTLRESEIFGRLRFLDAFGADAPVLSAKSVRRADAFVVELGERAQMEFETARAHFFAHTSPNEAQFAWLEEKANHDAEFQRGLSIGQEVRMQASRLIPQRSAEVGRLPIPAVGGAVLRMAGRLAEAALDGYEAALRDAFGYRLVDRNCVTELLAALESGLPHGTRTDRIGGGLDFIPFVSFESLVEANPTAQEFEVPSYRRTRLDVMYATENDVAVWLRESNTLTSTIYRSTARDSFFLFFTEDAGPARPILGALNVAAAVGDMALGLLKAPFDRGRTAWSGLKGVVFSLPELFFIDLRKGALDYAPADPPRTAARPSV